MSDEHHISLKFFIHGIKPESTKLSCLIEIEVETKHYPYPIKFRDRSIKYVGIENELTAISADADLETRIYCDGELIHKATEVEGDIDRVEYIRKAALEYLGRHLSEELKRAATNLYEEAYLNISSPAEREELIKQKVKREETAIRKRLPSAPNAMTQQEVGRFLDRALEAVEEVRKERLDYNRTNLATKMYPENSNPLQELRRQIKRAGFHNPRRKGAFDDLLWILADLYSRRASKSLFRTEGETLHWEESAFDE